MAKKMTKSTVKASAKKPAKGSTKAPVKSSKPAPKPVAKPIAKPAVAKKETTAKAKETKVVPVKPAAKLAVKSESVRPALMTARGKVKSDEAAVPIAATKPSKKFSEKFSEKLKPAVPATDENGKDFDNTGDQLIAMAKDEMSKINKTGEYDKSAEKTSKFKSIKIERGNLTDEKAKWQELNKRYGKEKAVTYKMSESFESLKPIQHKVLGWGFILTNDNNRLEVLFENGIKMLISNYKAN